MAAAVILVLSACGAVSALIYRQSEPWYGVLAGYLAQATLAVALLLATRRRTP
jgi:hypothetical protein